jgi:cytochrome c biogenesis protein CcmG/thiol:disulfide interchange protein DsbE
MLTKPSVLFFLIGFIGIASAADKAPDFVGLDIIDEKPLHLSDYLGKVVYIDFWASWCPPCLLSLPAYEKMRAEIGTEEFEIIAINVDEDPENGIFFLEDHPVSYPVLKDPEGDIGIPYRVRILPVSFLLDREGNIVESYRSFKLGDEEEIKQNIESLIQQ